MDEEKKLSVIFKIKAILLKLPIVLLIVFISQYANSAKNSYECKIINTFIVDDLGLLNSIDSPYKESIFYVDRKSGVVLGSINNSTYKYISILDPGGIDQSFKLLWKSHTITGTIDGINVTYLVVREFSENISKPFTLSTTYKVYSGLCQ